MAASKTRIDSGIPRFKLADTIVRDGSHYLAVRHGENDGPFHLQSARVHSVLDRVTTQRSEPDGTVYHPPHPSTIFSDVEGANYAYDDGTYWLFAACSPHEQIDFAADAQTFTYDQFSRYINRASLLTDKAKARAFVSFAEQASDEVFNRVRFAELGYYHRDQHKDHRRDLAEAAVAKVWAAWENNGSLITQRGLISADIASVLTHLRAQHTIDWRFQRDDARAAKGVDPAGGYEYVYTLVATKEPITDADELPDPNWHFDAQPVGGYRDPRGGPIYWDAEPTRTEALPYIIRFRRLLPTTAILSPGKSIGSVPWEQEAAY